MWRKRWQELASGVIAETPFVKILVKCFSRPDGTVIEDYYLLEKPSSIHVVAVKDRRKIILIEHYRPGLGEFSIELPAGSIERGETAEVACRRELFEETGYRAEQVAEVLNFSQDTSRFVGCVCHLFLARGLREEERTKLSSEEKSIKVIEVDLSEAFQMIQRGEIKDLPTIAGILFARLFVLYFVCVLRLRTPFV